MVTSKDVLNPLIVDPATLNDVESLRAELGKSNAKIMAMNHVVHSIGTDMARIVLAHIEGDGDGLVRELERIVQRNVIIGSDKPRAGMH